MRVLPVLALVSLAACVPGPAPEVSMSSASAMVALDAAMPPQVASFGLRPAPPPLRGNAVMAQDILDLTFRMETGRSVAVFSRFEVPVTVRLAGAVPASAVPDFHRLIRRLQSEAGIDISASTDPSAAITVEFLPRKSIQGIYANVACFVVPRVTGWDEFRRSRRGGLVDWTTLTVREKATVFIPADGSAQEIRDCLHEELAQALGPLNDLYGLSDSVFNDDNFHNTLTGFDMLVLRAVYAPELRSGMTEEQVAARLPAILARENPAGESRGGMPGAITPRQWTNAIETALGGRSAIDSRERAARLAVGMAEAAGWQDVRLALAHFALGRLTLTRDPATSRAAFDRALRIYRSLPGGEIHAAHVEMQLAAHDLMEGQFQRAMTRTDAIIPVAEAAENAALMATVMMMRAEALAGLGRHEAAAEARLDSLGWGRYGFGAEEQLRARMTEIAALARSN